MASPQFTVAVRDCLRPDLNPLSMELKAMQAGKKILVREEVLITILRSHFAPAAGSTPDLLFLPTSCGWAANEAGDGAPILGHFALAPTLWGAHVGNNMIDKMESLMVQQWPTNMVVLAIEVPTYRTSWDGIANNASYGRDQMRRWGMRHPNASALTIPYEQRNPMPPPATVPSLESRSSLVAFVGSVHQTDGNPTGWSPLRERLVKGCQKSPTDCVVISDVYTTDASRAKIVRGSGDDQTRLDAKQAYRTARFAFQPWGDTLSRAGIFDALMQGAIPVFFEHEVIDQYEILGEMRSMSVRVPLLACSEGGIGALGYLKALTADEVARLHENVLKYRRDFYMPSDASAHEAQGDAVDAIVRRVAEHFMEDRADGVQQQRLRQQQQQQQQPQQQRRAALRELPF